MNLNWCGGILQKMLNNEFRVLETLEDREQPNFAEQIVNSFFESSDETIAIFEQTLWVLIKGCLIYN